MYFFILSFKEFVLYLFGVCYGNGWKCVRMGGLFCFDSLFLQAMLVFCLDYLERREFFLELQFVELLEEENLKEYYRCKN